MKTRLLDYPRSSPSDEGGMPICRLVVGTVSDTNDSTGMGRVRVKIGRTDRAVTDWARVAAPMAGNDRGCYFPLQLEDEVLVALVGAEGSYGTCEAYVLGVLWNGKDKPPVDNSNGESNVCVIKSRSGHVIRFTDTEGKESLEIVDGSLRNSIVIDMVKDTVTITSGKDIDLSAPHGKITLSAQAIDISGTGTEGVKIHGPRVDLN